MIGASFFTFPVTLGGGGLVETPPLLLHICDSPRHHMGIVIIIAVGGMVSRCVFFRATDE